MTDIDPEMPEEIEVEIEEPRAPYPASDAWFVLLLIVMAVLGFLALSGVFGDDTDGDDPVVPTTVTSVVEDTVVDTTVDTIVVDTTIANS